MPRQGLPELVLGDVSELEHDPGQPAAGDPLPPERVLELLTRDQAHRDQEISEPVLVEDGIETSSRRMAPCFDEELAERGLRPALGLGPERGLELVLRDQPFVDQELSRRRRAPGRASEGAGGSPAGLLVMLRYALRAGLPAEGVAGSPVV